MHRTTADIALHRFGLGPRPGESKQVAADPRGWLVAQLDPGLAVPARLSDLPSHAAVMAQARNLRATEDPKAGRRWSREVLRSERTARFAVAASTAHPFRERWVRFFSNHLCVSADKRPVAGIVGAHEREAIRPHVVGPLSALLDASTRHPAMLVYLDNQQSVGPHSPLGQSTGRGLNENLAREVLELHTLGVGGGYTQADVVALAHMLTGWTVRMAATPADASTATVFARRRHSPGPKTLLGVQFAEAGEDEGRAALAFLAQHPSTAQHLAHKLAIHFIADQPPPAVVDRLARCIRNTEGDLREVGRWMVSQDDVWQTISENPKLRTPEELAIAFARASGWTDPGGPLPESIVRLERAVQWMGQTPLAPPSPAGWPDTAQDWSAPEQVLRRVELAERMGRQLRAKVTDPEGFAADLLGARLHPDTRMAVRRAPDRATALALLFASPELQWR